MRVYLAGPMTATTPEQADTWRVWAAEHLEAAGFRTSSPMRAKNLPAGLKLGLDYEHSAATELQPQAIFARDMFDVSHADLILANMLDGAVAADGSDIPSLGTIWEIAAAHAQKITMILVCKPESIYARHPFMRGANNIVRLGGLYDALAYIINNYSIYLNQRGPVHV